MVFCPRSVAVAAREMGKKKLFSWSHKKQSFSKRQLNNTIMRPICLSKIQLKTEKPTRHHTWRISLCDIVCRRRRDKGAYTSIQHSPHATTGPCRTNKAPSHKPNNIHCDTYFCFYIAYNTIRSERARVCLNQGTVRS